MNYRQLGNTGLKVSEIGFGCWGIGGVAPGTKSYGPVDDRASIAALSRALELGVNFYDTSDLYGRGHSEEVLAAAFRHKRNQVLYASKVGVAFDAEGKQYKELGLEHLRKSLEGSLRRLQTDYIDLYELHDPPMDALKADPRPIDFLKSAHAAGKIRAWGISAASPADGLVAIETFGAPAIQINFNMIDQRAIENGLLNLANRRNVGIIGRTPLCFGFLTGCYNADTKFDPADHRAGWSREQIALWTHAPKLFSAAIDPESGQTFGQIALRYCISYPAISTIIPGMHTSMEAEENIASIAWGPLNERQRISAECVYKNHVFFSKKGGK